MKRTFITVVISLLIGCLCGLNIGSSIFKQSDINEVTVPVETFEPESLTNDEALDAELHNLKSIARIDYPLIDIYFEKDKTYKKVVTDFSGDVIKEYSDKGEFFQFNKEYLSVLTFPSGRGTTPRETLI